MKKQALFFTALFTLLFAAVGFGVIISNVQFSPASPKDMQFGEQVNVTFDYYTAVFGTWGWKLASDINDAHDFLNGNGAYQNPVLDARVTAVWTGTKTSFYIFYASGTGGRFFGNWGWKLASNIEDAHNFINGKGAYQNPVKDAEITAVNTGTQTQFYIFYRAGTEDCLFGNWGWKLASSIADAHDFINGKGAYQNPVRDARIVSVWTGTAMSFYVFYQSGTGGRIFGGWGWKLAENVTDAHNFINGLGSYQNPVKDALITADSDGSKNLFHIFYNSKTDGDGLRIFVRPITNGSTTNNYSAHPSPLYPLGKGSGSGWFTINSGEVTVDSVRIKVYNADQSATITEKFIPVAYHFSGGTAVASPPEDVGLPVSYALRQNYPNPFNPTTTIDYALPNPGEVRLVIYDLLGRHIKTLVNAKQQAGQFQTIWNSTDEQNLPVATGVYLCRMEAGDFVKVIKLALVK